VLRRLRDALLGAYLRGPEHPTKYRVVQWLGRHAMPEHGIRARAHPDLALDLHPRDWIEYLLLRGERYEPLTLAFLAANLRPGDAALLAGVNFGQHVAVAARAVGPAGLVVGVEPQPAALLRAARNLRLNGLSAQVRLVGAALGRTDALLPMRWSRPENAGAASLLDEGEGLVVRVVPVRDVIRALCPAAPRLMLLDVQGFELEVLAGLDPEHLPGILVVEADPGFLGRAGTTVEVLFGRMEALGYAPRSLAGAAVTPGDPLAEHNVVGVRPGVVVAWADPEPR
jgi:FkbM family methyltransferase